MVPLGHAQENEAEEVATSESLDAEKNVSKNSERRTRQSRDLISILNSNYLGAEEGALDMITILGSSRAEGPVSRDYITVLGNSELDGDVRGDHITVLGNSEINGSVGRDTIVVLGNAKLGPNARLEDLVVVGGSLDRHEDAVVRGDMQIVPIPIPFDFDDWEKVHPFIIEGLAMGRFIVPDMAWTWYMVLGLLIMLALLCLVFPGPARSCIDALEKRPTQSVFAGIGFQLLGLPLVSIILLILLATVIGIIAIPFLTAGLFLMWLFSFVAVYGLVGYRFGLDQNLPLAVLVGGLVVSLGYAIPILGMLLFVSISFIGSGAVLIGLFSSLASSSSPRRRPFARTMTPEKPAYAESGQEEILAESELESTSLLYDNLEYEPVGFGPRLLAALIDVVIVAIAITILDPLALWIELSSYFLLIWLGYHVAFWVWKSTTLGGAALNLKLERIDGRDITIAVAVVRALASILSFVCVGMGFFWANWDEERQSWHDKIAGTVIVKTPKGVSLI